MEKISGVNGEGKKLKGFLCFLLQPGGMLHYILRNEEIEAANVTLDEATAHPALLVSERGRRVTWQETCQDLPRSTQRFNSIPCVLGQLRINSGRAYWEVRKPGRMIHYILIGRKRY